MRIIGAALLLVAGLLPARAGAVWGPFGGVARLESDDAASGVFDGFEAGVIAFGPEGEGFWQAAFTRLDQAGGAGRITRAGARLNFTLLAGSVALFYAGAGGGRVWNRNPAGDRQLWTWGAQAGLLVAPWEMVRRLSGPGTGKVGVTPGTFLLGAEAGWTQSPAALQGFEFRGFVTLLY